MQQQSYNKILSDKRRSLNLSPLDVARRIRLKPAIIDFIETADFDNLPPIIYSRKMVYAYAQALKLNPSVITNMFLQEYEHYKQKVQSRNDPKLNFDMSGRSTYNDAPHSFEDYGYRQGSDIDYRANLVGSNSYATTSSRTRVRSSFETRNRQREDFAPTNTYTNPTSRYSNPSFSRGTDPKRSRRSTSGRRFTPSLLDDKRPLIFAAVGVLLLVLIAFSIFRFATTNNSNPDDTLAVSGLTDPEVTITDEQIQKEEEKEKIEAATPPDKMIVTYKAVEDTYIEIYYNDDVNPSDAKTLTAGTTGSYENSQLMKINTTNPDGIKVFIDDVQLEFVDELGYGVYSVYANFDDYLAEWYKMRDSALAATQTESTPAAE